MAGDTLRFAFGGYPVAIEYGATGRVASASAPKVIPGGVLRSSGGEGGRPCFTTALLMRPVGKLRNRLDRLNGGNSGSGNTIIAHSASATRFYSKSLTIGRSYVPAARREQASGSHTPRDC